MWPSTNGEFAHEPAERSPAKPSRLKPAKRFDRPYRLLVGRGLPAAIRRHPKHSLVRRREQTPLGAHASASSQNPGPAVTHRNLGLHAVEFALVAPCMPLRVTSLLGGNQVFDEGGQKLDAKMA